MAYGKNFRPQSPDSGGIGFDNMIAQAAMLEATRLFTDLRIRAGDENTSDERRAASQLRSAMIDEICQLARQSKGKKFSGEEIEAMEKMKLWQLRSELGHWYSEAGIRMVKDPPKLNAFKVMEPYWIQVRTNREHYIKSGRAKKDNYKIIIIRETEATKEEVASADKIVVAKKTVDNKDNDIAEDMELLDRVEEKIEMEQEGEFVDDDDKKD